MIRVIHGYVFVATAYSAYFNINRDFGISIISTVLAMCALMSFMASFIKIIDDKRRIYRVKKLSNYAYRYLETCIIARTRNNRKRIPKCPSKPKPKNKPSVKPKSTSKQSSTRSSKRKNPSTSKSNSRKPGSKR